MIDGCFAISQQAITWTNVDQVLSHHITSPGHNKSEVNFITVEEIEVRYLKKKNYNLTYNQISYHMNNC